MNTSENEEDTKYCFNCRRNIPSSNHVMHTAYCHRNLKLCLKCDEPFLMSELEEHLKTMHTNILCDACSEKLESIDIESHKLNDCPHRLQVCNYCEIDIEASLLPAHIDMCSSRTERCNDCGQFIMLKYLALHKESHRLKKIPNDNSAESLAAYPPLIKKVPNTAVGGDASTTTRTTSMPTLRLHESIKTNHRVSPSVKRNNDQPQINTLINNENTNKDPKKNMPIVDTPSDDDEFPILGAHSIHNNPAESINNLLKNEYNNYNNAVIIPCEFCGKSIDLENIYLHQTGCRPDLVSFHGILPNKNKNTNSQNDKFPVPPLDLDSSSSDSEINMNTLSISSDDDCDDDEDSEKTNNEKIPCEFCEELISIKKINKHQNRCVKVHMALPIVNDLNEVNVHQPLNTNLPKSVNTHESRHNLFKKSLASADHSGRTLMLRNSDVNAQMMQRLPRVKLYNKQNSNRVEKTDNRYVNNSARNNYEQFLSNSRLNYPELASTRENPHLYLNPSGGAIPKQKNTKSNNNRRVINDLSKRKDSGSSSD